MIQLLSKYKSYILSFLLTVGMILSVNIFAAEPTRTLGFQGQFYAENTPGNNPVSATFTFYDSLTDGTVTGTPFTKIINVVNGYFGTQFTEADTSGVDLNQQLYLEISINGVTLSPRTTVNPTVSSLKSFGTFSYSSAPSVGPSGSLYFNTTTQELYVSNGTSWQLSGLASSTTQWVANGTSLNYMAGNVGIGTTTPAYKLHVVDTVGPFVRFERNSNGAGANFLDIYNPNETDQNTALISFSANTNGVGANSGVVMARIGAIYNSHNHATRSGSLVFYTANTGANSGEKMRLTGEGYLGIGTTTPISKLQVEGAFTISSSSEYFTTTLGSVAGAPGQPFFQSSRGYYSFKPLNTSAARMYVMPNGAVSGTTAKFEIFNTDYVTDGTNYSGFNIFTNNVTNEINIGANRNGSAAPLKMIIGGDYVSSSLNGTSAKIEFNIDNTINITASSTKILGGTSGFGLTVAPTGYVSVGNDTPASKLSVYENNTGTGNTNGLTLEQAGSGDALIHFLITATQRYTMGIDNSDGDKFKIGTNSDLGTNNLLTLTSTGNVGIGTTTPGFKLDVTGVINSPLASGYYLGGLSTLYSASGYTILNGIGGSGIILRGDSSTNHLILNNAGNISLTGSITSSGTGNTTFAGNVGIGTTTPASKLALKGSTAGSGKAFSIYDSTDKENFYILDSGMVNLGASAGSVWPTLLRNSVSGGLLLNTNGAVAATSSLMSLRNNSGTDIVTVLGNGNVGIGTTTPQSILEIADATIGTLTISSKSAAVTQESIANQIQFYGSDISASGTGVHSAIKSFADNSFGSSYGLSFYTGVPGSITEKMRISNLGFISIGTTTAAAKLTIQGAGTGLTKTLSTYDLNGNERVTFLDNGNVGIGTTSPSTLLSLTQGTTSSSGISFGDTTLYRSSAGNLSITGTNVITLSTANGYMYGLGFANSASANNALIRTLPAGTIITRDIADGNTALSVTQLNAASTGDILRLGNSAGAVMTVIQNGNVGIGTSNPGNMLDLFSAASSTIRLRTTNYTYQVGPLADDGVFHIKRNDGTVGDRLVIDVNGNVGIGTSTSSAKLQVVASGGFTASAQTIASFQRNGSTASDAVISIIAGNTAKSYLNFGDTDNENMGRIKYDHSLNSLSLGANGSVDQLYISSVGNVGIGTTSPAYKLHVEGTMGIVGTLGSITTVATGNELNFSRPSSNYVTATDATGLLLLGARGTLGILNISGGATNSLVISSTATANSLYLAGGNVGIGTSTPGSKFTVAGAINSTDLLGGITTLSVDASGNIIRTPSDSKLKTNVETLTSALDKVNAMRGVRYNWIDTNRFGTSSEIGFIAQELETIVPEVVKSGGEYKSVNYQNLTALLTEAIKELSAKFNNLSEVVKTKFVDADKVDTNELCIKKPDGTKVCLTATQLEQLLLNQGINNTVLSSPTPTPHVDEVLPPQEEEETAPAPEVPVETPAETPVETPTE